MTTSSKANVVLRLVMILAMLMSCVLQHQGVLAMRTPSSTRRHLMQDDAMMMMEGGEEEEAAAGGGEENVGGTTGLPDDESTDEIASLVGVENITISTNSSANQSLADAGFEIVPELDDPLQGTRVSLDQIEAAPIPTGDLDVLLPENELDADPDDLMPSEEPGME